MSFSERQIQEIEQHGLRLKQVEEQVRSIERGTFYYGLNRPCTIGDGIVSVAEGERKELVGRFEREQAKGRMLKFVPASGAASRMFKDWHLLFAGSSPTSQEPDDLLRSLPGYAFYGDLAAAAARQGTDLRTLVERRDLRTILGLVLTDRGLNYSNLPKALLRFHAYPEGNRTALEEHLVEAALHVRDAGGIARIHFTVSEEHRALVEDMLGRIRPGYEATYGVRYEIGLSIQMKSTDTIAVSLEGSLFQDDSGALVFRPGGHGALLENLNRLRADIVLIKNIDNIVPDRLKPQTVQYKKILGGWLLRVQEKAFGLLERLEKNDPDRSLLDEAVRLCREELCIVFPASFERLDGRERRDFLFDRLNRPIRVCGVVKNEGEPGGGPFWIDEEDGAQSLQIIESAQVDFRSAGQKRIWDSAGYFNPVDLACAVRDYRGNPFDLERFVDRRAVFISRKSQYGRDLMALEHPGLWNGAMARWNTVFMEMPIETFNPVKTVDDLLRKQHQP